MVQIDIPKDIKKTKSSLETYVKKIFSQFGIITNISGCEHPRSKKPVNVFITYTSKNEVTAATLCINKIPNNILSTNILYELRPKKPQRTIKKN